MQAVALQQPQAWAAYAPEPDVEASFDSLPPELQLLAAMARSQGSQSENARVNVEQGFEKLERLREEVKEAIERAREAEEDAGFWGDLSSLCGGDIATIAGAVASIALIVGTAGTGAAVIAAVALGMSIGARVGQELGLDPKICMGLQLAGAALGLAGGNIADASNALKAIHTGALVVQGSATAVGGGAHIMEGQCQGDAIEARGQANFLRGEEQLTQAEADQIMSELESLAERWRFATSNTSAVRDQHHQINSTVLMRIGA